MQSKTKRQWGFTLGAKGKFAVHPRLETLFRIRQQELKLFKRLILPEVYRPHHD
jgi:hypothetical protein